MSKIIMSKTISKYICGAGIELEGGWLLINGFQPPTTGERVLNEGCHITKDTSVKITSTLLKKFVNKPPLKYSLENLLANLRTGEIVSPVVYSVEDGVNFIERYWPDVTNASCGFHIHLSFTDTACYACLMEPEFHNYYKEQLKKFSTEQALNRTFNRRFNGQNKFCRDIFVPNKQAYTNRKYHEHRYAALNYCWGLHNTMECRVFCANMGVKKAVASFRWFVGMVDNYLNEHFTQFIQKENVAEIEIEIADNAEINLNRKVNIKPRAQKDNPEDMILYMRDNFINFYLDLEETLVNTQNEAGVQLHEAQPVQPVLINADF